MDDHDKLTELLVRMDHVQEVLGGNGGPGLCTRVDNVETLTDRHSTYFTLLVGAIPTAIIIIDILLR